MKKEIKLYNMIFPLWSFYLFPVAWFAILPANFVIDSIVFVAALVVLKIPEKKLKYKKCILRIWAYGFLADIIGAGALFFFLLFGYFEADNAYNPLGSPLAFALTSIGVILAGVCIYYFNYSKVLPLLELDGPKKKIIAMILAIITTPYTMYIPTKFIGILG